MPRISNLREIVAAADVLDVVGRRVTLRRQGSEFCGVCPFHGGSGRSFRVVPAKQSWVCHHCHVGGDALRFIMEHDKMELGDAAELLAAEGGIRVEYAEAGAPRASSGITRQDLYVAVEQACAFYQARLLAPEHAVALRYILERGFSAATVAEWRLGFAVGDGVSDCGADVDALAEAGVLHRSQDGLRVHDPLAGRLIIPLCDLRGRPCGFAGRVLPGAPDSAPKYLNTRDTPIYRKGDQLFGAHAALAARRLTRRPLHLIEGQLKAIALNAAGFPAVAPGGTGMSERQAAIVARLADDAPVVLCPDPDAAGTKAALRTAQLLRASGLTVSCGTLLIPDSIEHPVKDPDDLAALGITIAYDYEPFVDWAYSALTGGGPVRTEEQARAVDAQILPLVGALEAVAMRQLEYDRLAALSGISSERLASGRPPSPPAVRLRPQPLRPESSPISTAMTPGRYLCAILLQMDASVDPAWWSRVIAWTDLPAELAQTVQRIAFLRVDAGRRGLPLATVIGLEVASPLREYLLYWLTVRLPGPADISALGVVQERILAQARAEADRRRLAAGFAAEPLGGAA